MRALVKAVLPEKLRLIITTGLFLWQYGKNYGLIRSRLEKRVVDADGNAIPWYSYPAIEYLSGLDFSDRAVFEYGCGQSTLYWAARAYNVTSVEHNRDYHAKVSKQAPKNARVMLAEDDTAYVNSIRSSGPFDLIVIDGKSPLRPACAAIAPSYLKPNGLIVFDNSERFPEACRFLRERGYIQVDMHGPVPMGTQTITTSLFFARDFRAQPVGSRLPVYSRCAVPYLSSHDHYPDDNA